MSRCRCLRVVNNRGKVLWMAQLRRVNSFRWRVDAPGQLSRTREKVYRKARLCVNRGRAVTRNGLNGGRESPSPTDELTVSLYSRLLSLPVAACLAWPTRQQLRRCSR